MEIVWQQGWKKTLLVGVIPACIGYLASITIPAYPSVEDLTRWLFIVLVALAMYIVGVKLDKRLARIEESFGADLGRMMVATPLILVGWLNVFLFGGIALHTLQLFLLQNI
ncbi:MAG TPA: hypothetical protein VMR41_06420 [Patescibacteria group bacterium]|nr:hypothetical protein [Patescibacteria group bacterium]